MLIIHAVRQKETVAIVAENSIDRRVTRSEQVRGLRIARSLCGCFREQRRAEQCIFSNRTVAEQVIQARCNIRRKCNSSQIAGDAGAEIFRKMDD